MRTFICKCLKCGDLQDVDFSEEDKAVSCQCGGKWDKIVEKKAYFIMYNGSAKNRAKVRKMGG